MNTKLQCIQSFTYDSWRYAKSLGIRVQGYLRCSFVLNGVRLQQQFSSIEMTQFEALYSKKWRSWQEKVIRPWIDSNFPRECEVDQSKVKNYTWWTKNNADVYMRDLEFTIRDKVFLNLPSWKCVLKFRKRKSTIYWSYERLLIKLVQLLID